MRITVCYIDSETPLSHSGFAEVWKGNHEGKDVAAKVLRLYAGSDFEKIKKVGTTQPFVLAKRLIMYYAAILQGGPNVEHTSPSKFAAVGGRDDRGNTFCGGLGVDE